MDSKLRRSISRLTKLMASDMALSSGRVDVCVDFLKEAGLPPTASGMHDLYSVASQELGRLSKIVHEEMGRLWEFKPRRAKDLQNFFASEIYKAVEDLDTRLKM